MPGDADFLGEGLETGLLDSEVTADTGDDVVVGDDSGIDVDDPGGEDGEPGGEGAGESEGEDKSAAKGKSEEILPAQLAKTIRELKQAHPEQVGHIKELQSAYFTVRDYKSVYSSVDEARADKAALEAAGGTDGISRLRGVVDDLDQFDNLFKEGNPQVMDGLADQFPDGFKKLVPAALERLARMDQGAYKEAMRGPLLQMLEGDGLIEVISGVIEELKNGSADPATASRAQRELSRITQWYRQIKDADTAFKSRYQDPRVQELEKRERELNDSRMSDRRTTVSRDLTGYLNSTMRPEVSKILNGRTIGDKGRQRFEDSVRSEVSRTLSANKAYRDTLGNLIKKGDTEGANRFAKPYIDSARREAIKSVFTDIYGSNAAPVKRVVPANGAQARNGQQPANPATDKPTLLTRKPSADDIDWSKDPRRTMYIQHKAVLKNGKFVSWPR